MSNTYETRSCRLAVLALLLVATSSGCRVIYPGLHHCGPSGNVCAEIPREHRMVSMPDYIIEPPDILEIEGINLVPKMPYQLRVFDVLSITTTGMDEESAISGDFTVQPDGSVQLGPTLGDIRAVGLTRGELEVEILVKLKQIYTDPGVVVTVAQIAAQQQIAGEHLVAPDGKINLSSYGRVRVVGMTIEEARAAIEAQLSQHLEAPEIGLDVLGFNSKVYYVITQGAGLGDQVIILPTRGNETVLDAIGQIQGLQSNSSTRMWLARPGYNDCGGDQILPIDWIAVTQRGDIATNYQVMPGDRLYVSEDKLVALDTALAKVFSPIERVLGITLLGTQTVERIKLFGRFGGGIGGGLGTGF